MSANWPLKGICFRGSALEKGAWVMGWWGGFGSDMEADPGQMKNIIADHPVITAQMKAAFNQYWTEAIPLMVNEKAEISPTKPYHEWFREQEAAGGIPKWVAPEL
jgi:hypothetical protein